jgi:hypothetical protein
MAEDLHESTSMLILNHVHRESVEEVATRRDIERRAINTALVAGVFLAAVAIALHAVGHPPWLMTILFVVTAFLLGTTAFLAVRVLFGSHTESVDNSREFREAAERILSSRKDETAQHKLREFVIDRAKEWEAVNRAVHDAVDDKADKLREAQQLLIFAVIGALLTIIVSIFYLAAT